MTGFSQDNPQSVGTSEMGTRGVISPLLLANIALHKMETALFIKKVVTENLREPTSRLIRYADHSVVLHKSREVTEQAQASRRGMVKAHGTQIAPGEYPDSQHQVRVPIRILNPSYPEMFC